MSNWVAINAKKTLIDGDNNDASSSELPTVQAVSRDALSSGCSTTIDTRVSDTLTPPVSHPYNSRASLVPRPNTPTPWQVGPPPFYGDIDDIKAYVLGPFHTPANSSCRPSGLRTSNTNNMASPVPAVSAQDRMRQSLYGLGLRPVYRKSTSTRQNSAANRLRNTVPNMRLSADRVSDAIELNNRCLVRLLSPQADDLINRLLTEHKTGPSRRSNISAVSMINEYTWKLILETATEGLKVPVCRLSTIGKALKDVYNESEITDEAKRSDPILCCIKDLLNRIEQTLPLFADIPHIKLALASLRLKQVGLGNADPNHTHAQKRQGPAYPGSSSTQLDPDPPPPGRGLRRLECEADEGKLHLSSAQPSLSLLSLAQLILKHRTGFVQSRSGPPPPGACPAPPSSLPHF